MSLFPKKVEYPFNISVLTYFNCNATMIKLLIKNTKTSSVSTNIF